MSVPTLPGARRKDRDRSLDAGPGARETAGVSRRLPLGPHQRLDELALEGAELPRPTRRALLDRGVPAQVVLEGWPRPTVFTGELGSGRFPSAEAFCRRQPLPDAVYVIGSMRETQGYPHVRAAFGLQRGTGAVVLLDSEDPGEDLWVNAGLTAFLRSLELLVEAWEQLRELPASAPLRPGVDELEERLEELDPTAVTGQDRYWRRWLEELGAGE